MPSNGNAGDKPSATVTAAAAAAAGARASEAGSPAERPAAVVSTPPKPRRSGSRIGEKPLPEPEVAVSPSVVTLPTMAVIVTVVAILAIGEELFLPLAMGMLFAFILTPVVNYLRRRGLGDTTAVVLTVIAAVLLVGAFVLTFVYQLSVIGSNLPQYQGNVLTKIDGILETGSDSTVITRLQEMVGDITARLEPVTVEAADGGPMQVEVVNQTSLNDWLNAVILPALSPVIVFGLIAVVVVFALLERAELRDRLVALIGGSNIVGTSRMLAEAGARVSSYLLAQLMVNIIYAVPIWIGLWLIGVPNALFFGIVTLIMRFVPYIGTALSAILPLIMAFAVSPDWSMVLWTGALFLLVEFTTSNVIEPWFYGRKTGVSPLAVIVSAMFWTWIWGPMGLIIATPLTVCLVVIGHHIPGLRLFSILLGDNPVLEDTKRLYDRLLTGHAFAFDEATALASAGEDPAQEIIEYYDKQAIPVLGMAQTDHEAGLLTDQQVHRIATSIFELSERMEPVIEEELAEEELKEGEVAPAPLPGEDRRIAVLGARTALDDAAAELLGQAMRAKGAETLVMPHRTLPGRALREFKAEVLMIVALDGAARTAAAVQLRQLRRRFSYLRVVMATWPTTAEQSEGGAVVTEARMGADAVSVGMEEAFSIAFQKDETAASADSEKAAV